MIDKKTGKHYVYRLKHKPSGKYFHEFTSTMHNSQEIKVQLSEHGDRIFTSAAQLGKLWGRVEQLRVESDKLKEISSGSGSSSHIDSIQRLYNAAAIALQFMDQMELEISELFTTPNKEVEAKLKEDALKEQAFNAFKSRFATIMQGGGMSSVDMFNAFLDWEKMEEKDKWPNIANIEKYDGMRSSGVLNMIEDLGIKTHIFDPLKKPRIMAISDEDLNLLRLTNKNIIRNSIKITDALELKEEIYRQFGLNT